jgi:hypothetical protein
MLIKSSNDPEVTIQSRFQEQKIILKGNKQNIYKTIASSMLPICFQSADLVCKKIKELSPWFRAFVWLGIMKSLSTFPCNRRGALSASGKPHFSILKKTNSSISKNN